MSDFTPHQGQQLVKLARRTIAEELGQSLSENSTPAGELKDEIFQSHRASFVTLTLEGQLRGCIGSLLAAEPVTTNISKNAIHAAFNDPRFGPLSVDEFREISIDISILSNPTKLTYHDADDLLTKLRPGIDGVILSKDTASVTFLPQVWEQLPQPEKFLGHLCLKAGLSSQAWRAGDLEIQIYQVQYFKEEN